MVHDDSEAFINGLITRGTEQDEGIARLRADVDRLTREVEAARSNYADVAEAVVTYRALLGQLVEALRKLLYVALPTDVSGERWVREARAVLAAAAPYLPRA